MKTKLLFLILLCSSAASFAQSLSVTSFSANPAEANSDVSVDVQFTNSNPNEIIYLGLELLNSDGSWAATITEAILNPIGNSGTDITANIPFSIPANTTPSADLANGQYYRLKVELNAENWGGWLAGDYPNFEIVAQGTLSLTSNEYLNNVIVFPNPVKDIIKIKGLNSLETTNVSVVNVLGKTIKKYTRLNGREIDLSDLNSGVYVLVIKENMASKRIRIIKN